MACKDLGALAAQMEPNRGRSSGPVARLAEPPLKTTSMNTQFVPLQGPATAGAVRQASCAISGMDGMRCLVISLCARRGQALSWAASSAGWTVVVAEDAASAVRSIQRLAVQLAIVDLTEAPVCGLGEVREVVELLSRQNGSLLVVSGRRDDVHEERWARQLGVWMYLPDADADGLELICTEARQIAEKLRRPVVPAYRGGGGLTESWRPTAFS